MCRFSSEGLIKHLQSSGRPTEPRQPPASGCQALARWNGELPTSWPEWAEMPGSGSACRWLSFWSLYWPQGPGEQSCRSFRGHAQGRSPPCASTDRTLQKEGPWSKRHVPAWWLSDKARTSLNPLPIPILPKSSEFLPDPQGERL